MKTQKYKAQEESDEEVSDYPCDVIAFFEHVGFLVEKFADLDVIEIAWSLTLSQVGRNWSLG